MARQQCYSATAGTRAFLQVVFSEISTVKAREGSEQINLKQIITGSSWIGKLMNSQPLSKTHQWLQEFRKDNQKELAELIYGFVNTVDHLKTGKVTEIMRPGAQEFFDACKNEAGEYDFFMYLQTIKACKDFPERILTYIESSPLWNDWTEEVIHYDPLNTKDLLLVLQNEFIPAEQNSFSPYLELFIGSSGLLPKETVVPNPIAEFTEGGQLDIYKTLSEIRVNPKFSHYFSELVTFYKLFPRLPNKFSEIEVLLQANTNYVESLLWTLYSAFTSPNLSHSISKDHYVATLLKLAFSPASTAAATLSLKILCKILPVEHSPVSFTHLWKETFLEDQNPDICSMILTTIGKNQWANEDKRITYESKNLLLALFVAERWTAYITQTLISSLEEAADRLSLNQVIEARHVGSIALMSTSDIVNIQPFVFSVVSLKESAFSKGIVKEVVDQKTFMVYSAIDDTVIKVDISNITSIESSNIYQLLPDLRKNC